ncbi:hypothetical protein GN316_18130 [Xylophilus sp. Kf1]|nr:hypothetical protein [Xylophilus sp. Kf1]
MELQFLDFEVSEDADGAVVFDALASVPGAQLDRLQAEVAAVLDWAHDTFPGARAALEDGGEWDFQLYGAAETRTPQTLHYHREDDDRAGTITRASGSPGPARFSVSLSISGSAGFGQALREAFAIA